MGVRHHASALLVLVGVAAGLGACDTKGGSGGGSGAPKVAESGTKRGSAGGFSAQMSAELAKQNVEPAAIASAPAAAKPTTPASGTTTPASGTTTAATKPAAGSSTSTPVAAGSTSAGSTQVASAGTTQVTPTGKDVKLATPAAGQESAPSTPTPGASKKNGTGIENRVPAKPSAEIAAIKMDLEPNWERDIGEPGTFSLVVKVPATNEERVFFARYAYEDQASPVDCDAYRKFLEDKKIMTVTLNRQRGAACYIEGTETGGGAVYRYLLVYGGKHLMCSGSLYKEAALGDLRDKVLMQAKKICETLTL